MFINIVVIFCVYQDLGIARTQQRITRQKECRRINEKVL